eukprot:Gregarina_sp_Poly_1__11467@NODE_985_length_5470_cov_797_213215_g692_i0_p1_GENE_NODE_985_length_5470_cov_797_213215_g692_i0NODE_985_length_5470_cov_797_213215_g692_i0_p1_ORF_typecomplete_len845_score171_96ERM/PF00769_19/5_2e05ERM/PF00769_19/1_8e02CALCOCO1/PF07888_11/0_0018DUF745/PF05335_13/0_0014Myosin_tail_1/PF01576_19/0_008EzrA/PF06160_12/0_043Prominin/PF05478_11/0_12GAS/PF13851_6/0_23AAA_13/PF13166_6/0_28PKcGMP_CC/PF16808_5/0_17PKcGMP_CC/PF16808_5/1_4e03TACC_C/PF05010_14/1_1Nsp1_C/PF05064_13/5
MNEQGYPSSAGPATETAPEIRNEAFEGEGLWSIPPGAPAREGGMFVPSAGSMFSSGLYDYDSVIRDKDAKIRELESQLLYVKEELQRQFRFVSDNQSNQQQRIEEIENEKKRAAQAEKERDAARKKLEEVSTSAKNVLAYCEKMKRKAKNWEQSQTESRKEVESAEKKLNAAKEQAAELRQELESVRAELKAKSLEKPKTVPDPLCVCKEIRRQLPSVTEMALRQGLQRSWLSAHQTEIGVETASPAICDSHCQTSEIFVLESFTQTESPVSENSLRRAASPSTAVLTPNFCSTFNGEPTPVSLNGELSVPQSEDVKSMSLALFMSDETGRSNINRYVSPRQSAFLGADALRINREGFVQESDSDNLLREEEILRRTLDRELLASADFNASFDCSYINEVPESSIAHNEGTRRQIPIASAAKSAPVPELNSTVRQSPEVPSWDTVIEEAVIDVTPRHGTEMPISGPSAMAPTTTGSKPSLSASQLSSALQVETTSRRKRPAPQSPITAPDPIEVDANSSSVSDSEDSKKRKRVQSAPTQSAEATSGLESATAREAKTGNIGTPKQTSTSSESAGTKNAHKRQRLAQPTQQSGNFDRVSVSSSSDTCKTAANQSSIGVSSSATDQKSATALTAGVISFQPQSRLLSSSGTFKHASVPPPTTPTPSSQSSYSRFFKNDKLHNARLEETVSISTETTSATNAGSTAGNIPEKSPAGMEAADWSDEDGASRLFGTDDESVGNDKPSETRKASVTDLDAMADELTSGLRAAPTRSKPTRKPPAPKAVPVPGDVKGAAKKPVRFKRRSAMPKKPSGGTRISKTVVPPIELDNEQCVSDEEGAIQPRDLAS